VSLGIAERIARGNSAKALLEDPTLKEVFASAQRRAFEEFVAAETHAATERPWQTTQAIDALKLEFAALVGDGQLAEAEQKKLDRAEELKQLKARPTR
jgi:hypothetical protein